jgi:hypothetical protein
MPDQSLLQQGGDELVSVNLDTGDVMIDNVAVAALPRPSI